MQFFYCKKSEWSMVSEIVSTSKYYSSFRRLPLLKYLGVGEAKFRGSGRGVYSLPFHYPYFFSGVGLATRTPFLEW